MSSFAKIISQNKNGACYDYIPPAVIPTKNSKRMAPRREKNVRKKGCYGNACHQTSQTKLDQTTQLSIERVPDGEGSCMTLGKLFGTWTAPLSWLPEQIKRAEHFLFDNSDLVLLGYSKSGTHWLWAILHMLLKGKPEHSRTRKERLMLSFTTQEFFDTLSSPRVFNCHAPFEGLPTSLKSGQNTCKMVYLLRNPKDLAVSYYHHLKSASEFHYDGSFHGFLELFLQGIVPGGSWFDYVLEWEQTMKNNPRLPIITVHYEDLKQNTLFQIRRIAEFIGLEHSSDLYSAIVKECSIRRMKHMDECTNEDFNLTSSKTGKNYIYRKGEVGDWKNWFSTADNKKFDAVMKEKMKDSSLAFRYEIDNTKCSQE